MFLINWNLNDCSFFCLIKWAIKKYPQNSNIPNQNRVVDHCVFQLEFSGIILLRNFPKKQIGKFMSECLVLGAVGEEGDVILLAPDFKIENGLRIG